MPSAKADPVQRLLRALRWRMRVGLFLTWSARVALALALVLLLAGAINHWWLGRFPWDPRFALGAGAVALAVLAGGTATLFKKTLPEVARAIDQLGGTNDRLLTALAFTGQGVPDSSMAALAVGECRAFLAGKNFAPLVPVRFPRELGWLVAPAVGLAFLQWDAEVTDYSRRSEEAAAQAQVATTVQQLEGLARTAEKAGEQSRDDEMRRIAEALKRGADQLRANTSDRAEAEKAALRELSALEQLVKQMQEAARSALSPEELKALAKALEQNSATKDAAQMMENGKLADAAKQLDEAAKQLATKGSEQAAEEVEKTLRNALERVAQDRKTSEAMRQLAQMAQQEGAASKALRQLAGMLRQAGQNPQNSPQSGGGKQTQQSLQNLLAALQALKHGQPVAPPDGGDNQKGGHGQMSIQNFAQRSTEGEPLPGVASAPTGKAGSERDEGTTGSPFGEERSDPAEKGADLALRGQLGEGETLSQFLPGARDDSKAQRRYKELYDAMAPAVEEAVVQEEIPLGSRFFIKRYFEAIRPLE